MKFHGITLEQGANINNLVVAAGTSFPANPDEGELFFRNDAALNVKGLYIYVGGNWDRVASADSLTSPVGTTLPSEANPGDLFYRDTNDSNEGLYVYNGTAWVAVSAGGAVTFNVTGDVSGTLDGGTDLLTLATVNGSPGAFGSASQTLTATVNSKGLIISMGATNIDINASQVGSGTFADGRISQSSVTQHQAALSIAESQIQDGAILARVTSNETVSGTWSFNNPVAVGTPVSDSHAATKQYVDTLSAGVYPHQAVRVATTGNITLSGTQTIDGVAVLAGDRVLVKDQTTASQNGIYVVAAGAWARASDFDGSPSNEALPGDLFFVTDGTVNANTAWTLLTPSPITIGTTALTFSIFSRAADITAGTGLTRTGNTIDVVGAAGRIVANIDNIDLATVGTPVTDVLRRITTDAYGRVTGTSAVQTNDLSGVLDTRYVRKDLTSGDTMIGNLTISRTAAAPQLVLNSSTAGNGAYQFFQVNGINRWVLGVDSAAESGSDAGSNFFIQRYNDAGGVLSVPLSINRATGQINFFNNVVSNSDILTTGAVTGNLLSVPATATGTGTTRLFVDSPAGQTAPIVQVLKDSINLFSISANGSIVSSPTGSSNDRVLIIGNTTTDAPNVVVTSRAPSGTAPGKFTFRRTNGESGPTPDSSNLGQLMWDGLDTAAGYREFAQIRAEIGTNTATGAPTTMFFRVHNGTSLIEELRIDGSANLITASANLTISTGTPFIAINASSGNPAMFIRGGAGTFRNIVFQTGTSDRWRITGGNGNPESGSNTGSDFQITRFNDAGTAFSEVPLSINRATGLVSSNSDWYISRSTGVTLTFNTTSTSSATNLDFRVNNSIRWLVGKNGDTETGSNAGSNFVINRYSDAGTLIDTPLVITRSSGNTFITSALAEFRSDQINMRKADNSTQPMYLSMLKSRGTQASPTAVQAADGLGAIQFYGRDSTNDRLAAQIGAVAEAAPANSTTPGALVFSTTPAGTSQTPIERVRITSGGLVGIGTGTSITNLLHLKASNPVIRLEASTDSAYLDYDNSRFNVHAGGGYLVLTAGNTERVRVTATGSVGINTTAPTEALDINDDTIRLRVSRTPASSSAAGNTGDICWDANYLYICIAPNTWRRVAHSTW